MDSLYSTVEISKALQNEKEKINYFVLKDDLYGLKITRAFYNSTTENDEVVMRNIFKDENDVKNLIDTLINQGNDFSQIQYVVDDYKSMYQNRL